MSEHPESIPRISNPASIFFLVNSQNFTMAWERWLQPALDLYGIAVGFKSESTTLNEVNPYLLIRLKIST